MAIFAFLCLQEMYKRLLIKNQKIWLLEYQNNYDSQNRLNSLLFQIASQLSEFYIYGFVFLSSVNHTKQLKTAYDHLEKQNLVYQYERIVVLEM